MSGVLSIYNGLKSGTLAGLWQGYQSALVFKPPLVCIPAALLMWLIGGVTLPCLLSLVVTFAALGLISYSFFQRCLRPYYAAIATTLLLTMPMINGLTHRFYVELLLVLLCVIFLDMLARRPWCSLKCSALIGCMIGLGVLCKTTFPALVAAPAIYSLGEEIRERKRNYSFFGLFRNVACATLLAILVAWSWYGKNWAAALHHVRLNADSNCCYYSRWIQADISVGPWIAVFLVAVAGFVVVLRGLLRRRLPAQESQAWTLILLLGLSTAVACGLGPVKTTRYSATWLPTIASLAAGVFASQDSRRWARYASAGLAAASILIALHNSFNLLPVSDIRLGDVRIVASRFPLDVPGWYDNNHPIDRRELRLAEAESIIAQDATSHLASGQIAEARTTTLGLLLNFDYFRLLATARKSPVNYMPWPGGTAAGPDAPDYMLCFTGFEHLYPGLHYFNYYPGFMQDVSAGKVPYRLLSHLAGPSETGIWIYAKQRLKPRERAASGDLLLEAENFQRGNVAVDLGEYGRNIGVIVTPRAPAYAEYDVSIAATGQYQIDIRYASGGPRPVTFLLDGAVVSKTVASGATGGFSPESQRWEAVAVVRLTAGRHIFRIESANVFPHIDRILVSREEK
jgi:hypothetical protein